MTWIWIKIVLLGLQAGLLGFLLGLFFSKGKDE